MQVKESFNGSLQILGAGFIYQITPIPMHTGETSSPVSCSPIQLGAEVLVSCPFSKHAA